MFYLKIEYMQYIIIYVITWLNIMEKIISEFNKDLIKYNRNCDIIEYIHSVNNLYKESLDLSFMEDFIKYINIDECCIPHTLLIKYGIFSKNTSTDIKKRLVKFNEDDDYRLCSIAQSISGGCTHKNIYYLHPRTFKKY